MSWEIEAGFKAWRHAPLGESEFESHAVVKDNKMVIVSPSYERLSKARHLFVGPHDSFHIVALPKIEHMTKFSLAGRGTDRLGPSEDFPGSVGSIACKYVSPYYKEAVEEHAGLDKGAYENIISVESVQAHFRTGKQEFMLSRSLATKYGGWRTRCLEHAIRIAGKTNAVLLLNKATLSRVSERPRNEENLNAFEKDLKSAAKRSKTKLEENRFYYIVNPNNKTQE